MTTLDVPAAAANIAGRNSNANASIVSRSVQASGERLIVQFDPVGYPVQPSETLPDYEQARPLALLAAEQKAFLATIDAKHFVDIEMPDND